MYDWRRMTENDRAHALEVRRARQLPWHSPPHLDLEGTHQYLISAACYEHASIIGKDSERMTECEEGVLKACSEHCLTTHGWCVLPNHYHVQSRLNILQNYADGWDSSMAGHRMIGMARTQLGV